MATDRRCPRMRARVLIGAATGVLALGATPALAVNPVPAGPRETAAILMKFAPDQAEPFTPEQVRSAVFTGSNSAAAFHAEQSFGRISLTGAGGATSGDVFGWYTIAGNTTTCDPDVWMALADGQAAAAGVDLSGYEHRAYFFPRVTACGWAGLADVSGPVSFLNGTISTRVISHELGHNLGSFHAASLRCVDGGNAGVTVSASCTSTEYGDPFDVMGSSSRHQSALSKVRYGFIPSANEVTAAVSGTYLLQPASVSAATGVQSLRVRRGATNAYWHFERRSTAGAFDSFLTTDPAVNGVTVRLSDDAARSPWHTQTYLVDANPATTSLADAPLPVGGTFTDPTVAGGPSVTVVSNGPGGASVRVSFPGDPGSETGGETTTPSTGTSPGTSTPGTTPPITTPTPPPTATVTVRRIDRTRGVVRIRVPAGPNASCRSRVAAVTWLRCRPTNGVATINQAFHIRRSTVSVGVKLSGTVVLGRRFRIPVANGGRRVTVVPIRAPHDHSAHPH